MTNDQNEAAKCQDGTVDQQIEQLEQKIEALRPVAFSWEPSPAKGMAMLRKARAKNELTKAKNKRTKDEPK